MKVLYVEDNKEARTQTVKMLQDYFEDIVVATDGKEGLKSFKNGDFHIVFTDIEMPVMDGITMIKQIRELNSEIPIVILSAYDDKDYLLNGINLGIDGYILKPYNFKKISELITKIVIKLDVDIKSKNRVFLIEDYVWHKDTSMLMKNDKMIKLTKSETKFFEVLAKLPKGATNVDIIEPYVFGDISYDSARIRKIVYRLKLKLGVVLIESNYAHGYFLRTI
jgi:DNA-binding response OmpR family regulator